MTFRKKYKSVLFILTLCMFGFVTSSTAKEDIAKQPYEKNDTNHTSVDVKKKNSTSEILSKSKCNAGRCGIGKCGGISQKPKEGMSHAAKCGSSSDKCSGGKSHGSKCG